MKQSKALALLKSGKNVFLTGSAGTGKTFVLNQYINYLRQRRVKVAITASTGIAATHLNGQTIHSWSGIGIKDKITTKQLAFLSQKKYFADKMEGVKVLIIDEISMLHKNQLDMVNEVLKFFKHGQSPFGGIQVIFCGDFFQLPPVGNETSREKFAFMSDAWQEANLSICYLTEQFRQKDSGLHSLLNQMRKGEVEQNLLEQLTQTKYNTINTDSFTQLFTHNQEVNFINREKLDSISEKPKIFKAKSKGKEGLLETLKKSVLTDEILELKKGAQVMFIKNNFEKGFSNGTLGKIISFSDEGFPVVETFDKQEIEAKPETWAIEDEKGTKMASFTQIPLRLAWAITVHKSQGMTLDAATIDLSKTFEPGQGYVALSRLKSLDNLVLLGINEAALQIDALARKADKRFQELSEGIDNQFSENELQKNFDAFVLHCDGIIDLKEIKKHQQKLEKKDTVLLTKEWVEKKLSIKEIAEERGLTEATIANHLMKIKTLYPNLDLSAYKPEKSLINRVQKAFSQLNEEEKNSLKHIFDALNGEVSYTDIRLALMFL